MVEVSVVLTTYNLENIISKTLSSLVAQSFSNWEFIIVDDGSCDDTIRIIKKYEKEFDFIKLYKNPHKGAGAARNEGLYRAKGEYILFLDGDDIFNHDFLYKMYKSIKENDADIVICNSFEFKDSEKNIINKNSHGLYPPGWAWDKIFKKSLIIKNNLSFSNLTSSNDLSFTYSAYFLAKKTVKIPDYLVYRRIRNNSVSDLRSEKNAFLALLELKENLIKNSIFDKFSEDYKNIALRFIFWHFITCKDKNARGKIIEFIRYFENEFDILRMNKVKYKKEFEFYKIVLNSKTYQSFRFLWFINCAKRRLQSLFGGIK